MTPDIMHVELDLGRSLEHPFGESGYGYHLYLPLRPDGHLDMGRLRAGDGRHRVRRQRPGEEPACGRLAVDAEGRLLFSFDGRPSNRQIGFATPPDRFLVGHRVAVAEEDGETRVFQVVAVRRE